jgi:hypothetical protein
MPIFCSQCNKDFNFENIPTGSPVFCPDCGLSATIIDESEILQKTKKGNRSSNSHDTSSSLTDKLPPLNPVGTMKTEPTSSTSIGEPHTTWSKDLFHTIRTKKSAPTSRHYSRHTVLILSSLGSLLGVPGIGHLYIKKKLKGICFLISGLFFYIFIFFFLNEIYWNRPEKFDPDSYGGLGFVVMVYLLICLAHFIDIIRLTKYSTRP